MNKQQLQQEIEELQKQLEEKQKDLSSIPDKWEPKGGKFWISSEGVITVSKSSLECAQFGSEYATQEQAEKAAKAMRAHNRLLAYVAEFAPSFEFDPLNKTDDEPACIKVGEGGLFEPEVNIYKRLGTVYMPLDVAYELCRKLNSGEVEL